jgi:hypothetical protein
MDEEIRMGRPDPERAQALLKIAADRERAIDTLSPEEFATIIAEGRYEVIKETVTALMLLRGFRTASHESLIRYLEENHPEFTKEELLFLDSLRKLRNDINYRGYEVNPFYLQRHQELLAAITAKLRALLTQYA